MARQDTVNRISALTETAKKTGRVDDAKALKVAIERAAKRGEGLPDDARRLPFMHANAILQNLYDSLPKIQCKGLCHDSCTVIVTVGTEARRIRKASKGFQRKLNVINGKCSALFNQRCSIYADRPMICRLFGVTESMPCPHGCEPDKWLTDKQANALMHKVRALL